MPPHHPSVSGLDGPELDVAIVRTRGEHVAAILVLLWGPGECVDVLQ